MKAYWGSGSVALRIFGLDTRWRWVVSFMPRPIYPQVKSPCYPLDRRLGEPQSRSGRGGEERNSQPLPGLEPPTTQTVIQRYTIKLTRLPPFYITYLKCVALGTCRIVDNISGRESKPQMVTFNIAVASQITFLTYYKRMNKWATSK
jgi:hypothetical protein